MLSRKATRAQEALRFEQIPNIGRSIAADLRALGLRQPSELLAHEPLTLYQQLGRLMGQRHDPCVLDVLLAARDFMAGGAPRPWWQFTAARKARWPQLTR